MKNLYVVAIGGSGERVMRALLLMLASGVNAKVDKIIPVFMENDVDSNALKKCLSIIKYYNDRAAKGGKIGVNSTYSAVSDDAAAWPSFCRTLVADPILLNRSGSAIGNLAQIIGNVDPEKPIEDRIAEEKDLLFAPEDLSMPLTVGFVGNPNIGSVVLNSLSLADQSFKDICSAMSPEDGMIVVGSLFGGTGAAGIPLVINHINSINPANRPILGAVALLPYFTTNKSGSQDGIIDQNKYNVNPDSFDTKTRAALMYYDDYMRTMDYMYYVGDGDSKDVFSHCVGGVKQENPAHLVELLAANSILDFAKKSKPEDIVYRQPIWNVNTEAGKISCNISSSNTRELTRALVKFRMLRQLFRDPAFLKWAIEENRDYVMNIGVTEDMRANVDDPRNHEKSNYTWGLNHIFEEWEKWMTELSRDDARRKFQIYNSSQEATSDNITHRFCAEGSEFGIALTEMRRDGIFGPKKLVGIEAQVNEALQKAYKRLYPNGKKSDAANYGEEQRLPRLLKIISDALDSVINDRCIDSVK